MLKNNCKKCGHVWIGRTDKPKQCPKCKVYSWKIDEEEVKEK